MKLNKQVFQKKDKTEGCTYLIKKRDDENDGMVVGDILTLEMSFDPKSGQAEGYMNTFQDVSFKRDGVTKTFKTAKFLAKPVPEFENYEGHEEYGNASFSCAGKTAEKLEKLGFERGDLISFENKKFDKEEDGKVVSIKYFDIKKVTAEAQETLKTEYAQDVLEVVGYFKENKDEFMTKFLQMESVDGKTVPRAFIEEFRQTQKDGGIEGEYSEEDIIKVHKYIMQVVM
jgi:hypothetical protein